MVSPVRTAGIVQEAWRICLENLICASSRVSILQRVSPQHALFDLPMAVPTRLILRPRGRSVFVDEQYELNEGVEGPRIVLHGLVGVEDVQEGLGGHQVQLSHPGQVEFAGDRGGVQCAAVLQDLLGVLGGGRLVRLVAVLTPLLLQTRHRLLHGLQVGEDQLGLDHRDIGRRVNAAVDVDHVVIGESTDDLTDRVRLANVRQKGVAHPLTLGGTLDDAGDVDEGHRRRQDPLGGEDLRQTVQAGVWQLHQAHVGLDGGERVVRREDIVTGQGIEQGGLANVGQADDSESKGHGPHPNVSSSNNHATPSEATGTPGLSWQSTGSYD